MAIFSQRVSRGHECQNKHLKTSMKGIWAMRKPMMRSDLTSEAVRRPKQPRKYSNCQFFTISPEGLTMSFMISPEVVNLLTMTFYSES